MKGKLVEAMFCSTPSVTTDIGAESMQTHLPWAGEIANDAESIANAAVKLYQNAEAWQSASDLGQKNAQFLFEQNSFTYTLMHSTIPFSLIGLLCWMSNPSIPSTLSSMLAETATTN